MIHFTHFSVYVKKPLIVFNVSSERRETELWLVCRELKFSNCYIKHDKQTYSNPIKRSIPINTNSA